MPYGADDYQHLAHVFVSHARFLTAGIVMGSAIVGVNYWVTSGQLSGLTEQLCELKTEVKELKTEVKTEVKELKSGFRELSENVKNVEHGMAELKKSIELVLEKK